MDKKRLLSKSWKPALVLLIVLIIIYRLYFAPIPVQSHTVKTGPIAAEVMGTGTLEARVEATISAKISGRLSGVYADQGDRVAKDQLLATLDDADFCQQVEMAKAEVEAIKAGIDRAAADVNSVQATAVHARAFYKRMTPLAQNKVVSEEDFDIAIRQRDVAEAQLSRSKLAKIEMERQLVKAQATLRFYKEKLADTKVFAPFDGLIIRRDRDQGAVVVPGSSILRIISTDQMWVSVWVDESAISQLIVGQQARIVYRCTPEKSYQGTLARISPLADRETREFLVDVLVEELPKTWAVGQRAEVYIQTAKNENALLVPSKAVVWQKGKPGLFICNSAYAKWVNVEIGLLNKDFLEIQSGLNINDIVIWSHDAKKAIIANRAVRIK